jgi:4-hydroxy-tetrahydrodipicolinate synthase
MEKNRSQFRGFGVAMVTPFRDGKIDWPALDKLIEMLIQGGVDFIVPCGTTGESPTLSSEEHINVIVKTVNTVKGRVPVLAGTGSNNFSEALEMTKLAKASGADGAMVVVPYYSKPTETGIIMHYDKLANAVDLPIILYDIPGRTGIKVSSKTIISMANAGVIHGLKWASGDLHQLEDVLAGCPDNFDILSGNDDQTLDLMIRGGHGVISVIGNILPTRFKTFIRLMQAELWGNSKNTHMNMINFMRLMFIESNPAPVKAALSLMYPDIFTSELRLPMWNLTGENLEILRNELNDNDLL